MITDDERESLHYALDAILNARNFLEVQAASDLTSLQWYDVLRAGTKELFENASAFLRRVIGPTLHKQHMDFLFDTDLKENAADAEVAAGIAKAIKAFLPLFMAQGRREWEGESEPIVQIIDDLYGISWGDEPRFFATGLRVQGLHKRPYRLASLRLSALNWDKYLATVGMSAFERHRIISDAFRTDWEAIRKWANSIENFELNSFPPKHPDWAKKEFAADPERVLQRIQRDGDEYWLERGTAGKDR